MIEKEESLSEKAFCYEENGEPDLLFVKDVKKAVNKLKREIFVYEKIGGTIEVSILLESIEEIFGKELVEEKEK